MFLTFLYFSKLNLVIEPNDFKLLISLARISRNYDFEIIYLF